MRNDITETLEAMPDQSTRLAWHFVKGDTLRDGQPLPADGERLTYTGELKMCSAGYHASKRIIDALTYAPGTTLCRVEHSEECIEDTDKLVARWRTVLWRMDTTEVLRRFARECALSVVPLWDAPEVVGQYLTTGDESLRAAAEAAAMDARAAAMDARVARDARVAAWDVARAAAWDAARAVQESLLLKLVEGARS